MSADDDHWRTTAATMKALAAEAIRGKATAWDALWDICALLPQPTDADLPGADPSDPMPDPLRVPLTTYAAGLDIVAQQEGAGPTTAALLRTAARLVRDAAEGRAPSADERAQAERWARAHYDAAFAALSCPYLGWDEMSERERVAEIAAMLPLVREARAFEQSANHWRETADRYCDTISERDAKIESLRATPAPLTEAACLADILAAWKAWPGRGEGYEQAAVEAMVAIHEALYRARYISPADVTPDGEALSASRGDIPADVPAQPSEPVEPMTKALERLPLTEADVTEIARAALSAWGASKFRTLASCIGSAILAFEAREDRSGRGDIPADVDAKGAA